MASTNTMMDQWIQAAQEVGFYEYILPFILIFAIVYGILERINLFGDSGGGDEGSESGSVAHKVHVIIAFSISFFVIAFTPAATTMSAFFINFSGVLALILVGILGAMIVFGLLFSEEERDDGEWFTDNWYTTLLVIGIPAAILLYVGLGGFAEVPSVDVGLNAMTTSEIIGIVIIAGTLLFLGWAIDILPSFGDD